MAFFTFLWKNNLSKRVCIKRALVIWRIHRNWKLLPEILKFLESRIFYKITIGSVFLFFSKQETLSCDIFVKMRRPKILLVLQILHKNITEGTLLSLLQKSAPVRLLWKNLTPQLEFWRSSFFTKKQPKECASFCAPFLLNLMEKDWVQNTTRKLLFGN